jgi:hypothetical protein
MESIWKPVAANEGFEVVRRRLFLDCKKPNARDAVCAAFSAMYNENETDFPIEARELEYKERMGVCYPIHPEVFDRLYKDWSTLERFQRTRGVLRLMAGVVYELWMGNDASLMIMPALSRSMCPMYVMNSPVISLIIGTASLTKKWTVRIRSLIRPTRTQDTAGISLLAVLQEPLCSAPPRQVVNRLLVASKVLAFVLV